WLAAVVCALEVALLGALMERLLLRRLTGQQLAQVLVTLGVSFMVADLCLMGWGGDPISVATPPRPQRLRPFRCGGVSALPARGDRHRRHLCACVVAHAGTNAAWRHDSRWRRRSADGPRRRHPGLATVYNRICTRRRHRRLCRVNRRPHPLR